MAVFNAIDPVVVGLSTKADHYHRVFDNTVALQQGNVALAQVMLDGAAADPAVAPAGDAVIYYNTTDNEARISKNGATYESLGVFPPNDPIVVGGSRFSLLLKG